MKNLHNSFSCEVHFRAGSRIKYICKLYKLYMFDKYLELSPEIMELLRTKCKQH